MESSSSISKKSLHNNSSSTTAPHVEDLLTYLPTYRVLICKDCHFAIQPSALSSHLLRHGFYRGNRKKLTKTLEQLDLAEPEDVPVPSVDEAAVEGLPVGEGWVCEFVDGEGGGGAGCGHACMAEKRMAAHWREVHDRHHVSEVKARRARLQTFFRGSKTRYFEVERGVVKVEGDGEGDGKGVVGGGVRRPALGARNDTAERFYGAVGERVEQKGDVHEGNGNGQERRGSVSGDGLGPALQLQDLTLLHYWHIRTGATISRGAKEDGAYWTNTVTGLALESEFLMRSLLAMTAVHCAYLGIKNHAPKSQIRAYHNAALTHHSHGLAGFRKALEEGITASNAETFASSGRLLGLAFGAGVVADDWLEEHSHPYDSPSPQEFFNRSSVGPLEFLLLVRGSVEIQVSAQGAFGWDTPFRLPAEILNAFAYPSPISSGSPGEGSLDPRLAACVAAADSVRRPTTDTQALDSAIASLSFCYAGGLPSHPETPIDEHTLWMHSQAWPRLVSETYLLLLQAEDPAALIVYAHWCYLVRRLEGVSWYLQGMSGKLVEGIQSRMREQGYVLEGCLGETERLFEGFETRG
ncbi:hypothetical protein M409DRAFT_15896 [Zasmidium cellare ATCC 36951]|uniref:C2H2-type domain-containing protein n=1 Tax=Zasmidium cellare ATCC 36951 TaxID=1080233 RepID=A0A6A6D5D0_ZASCE|nr:uncharacterized protein M409DRAFT_15896 [Zasmidium cellare ATCC 36951]KAF2173618.1 hypothetical protein M409DRAFT_15896 [Zasmidium cellare ATCC 36951]